MLRTLPHSNCTFVSYLVKSLFRTFAHFKIIFLLFMLSYMICKYLLPLHGLTFYFFDAILWIISLNFLILIYLFCFACAFGTKSQKPLLNPRSHLFLFTFRSLIVVVLKFRLDYAWDRDPNSFLCLSITSCVRVICWKDCFFFTELSWLIFELN